MFLKTLAAKAVEDLTQSTEVAIKSDLKALELKIVKQLDLKISKSDLKEFELKIVEQLNLKASKSDLKELALKIVEQLDLKIAAQLAQLETRLMWRMLGGTAILLSVTVALLKII